jgi:ketosteroid isomerase-like protein
MVRDKPLETLAPRRRLGDRLPCTSLTASCDDHRIDHGQKHEPRPPGHARHQSLDSSPPNDRRSPADSLVVHPSDNGCVVILEYEVHGTALATDAPYENRFVSIATIESRKIVRWRDYMDSLAARTALTKPA